MPDIIEPPCLTCMWTTGFVDLACLAFPEGIPEDIISGRTPHIDPWPVSADYPEGDRGLVYKEKE